MGSETLNSCPALVSGLVSLGLEPWYCSMKVHKPFLFSFRLGYPMVPLILLSAPVGQKLMVRALILVLTLPQHNPNPELTRRQIRECSRRADTTSSRLPVSWSVHHVALVVRLWRSWWHGGVSYEVDYVLQMCFRV